MLLAPAGYDTLVGPAGPVLASPRDPTGPVPSLDDAFASAGDGFGADALVIGLSSAGTDGVVGASRVLAAGGRVWTVHPDEAEFPLLARSLAALDGVRALSSAQLAAELRRAGA